MAHDPLHDTNSRTITIEATPEAITIDHRKDGGARRRHAA